MTSRVLPGARQSNVFDMADAARRGLIDPEEYRVIFLIRWSRLTAKAFGTPEQCAEEMGVTLRAARYWFTGSHRPTGDKVALLSLMHPDLFARIMGGER